VAATVFGKYLGQFKAGSRVALSYHFDFIVGIITTPLALVIYYFLWRSIYEFAGATVIQGFTFPELISYYVLSMIVGFLTWSETDKWLERGIRQGSLTRDLVKPMAFMGQWLGFEVGMNAVNIVFQITPIFFIGLLFFGLLPASAVNIIAFALSTLLAFFLYFGLTFLNGLSAFWLQRITGMRRVRRVLIGFLGGSFIPLSFFPPGLQTASHFLPFEYIRFVPINIYLGRYPGWQVLGQLGLQLAWIVALYALIAVVGQAAIKKYARSG
jgi:ABC-2 type transport system permease protein